MTKKKIIRIGLALTVTMGMVVAAVMDPDTRMRKISELFSQYGKDATFILLNGQDIGGSGTAGSHKGTQSSQVADIATVTKSDDGQAFVFCVSDGKWVVYPPEPMKIGTDATTATDANGRPFVETMIKALRKSDDGKAHHIRYDVATPDGRIQQREATLWKASVLLGDKYQKGARFFCGTSVRAIP